MYIIANTPIGHEPGTNAFNDSAASHNRIDIGRTDRRATNGKPENGISIFPNPSRSTVTVNLKEAYQQDSILSWKLVDLVGQTRLESVSQTRPIMIHGLDKLHLGTYHLLINNGRHIYNTHFVISL